MSGRKILGWMAIVSMYGGWIYARNAMTSSAETLALERSNHKALEAANELGIALSTWYLLLNKYQLKI